MARGAPYVPARRSGGELKRALNYLQTLRRQGSSKRPKQRALTGAPGLSVVRRSGPRGCLQTLQRALSSTPICSSG